MKIVVNDKMQSGYEYELVCKQGADFSPLFKPELTPKQMLEMGVFEGKYLCDCKDEFPSDWFANAKLSPNAPDAALNFFGIKSRQSLQIWQEKGWIINPDPRGWFQWYCRYYMGRRITGVDEKQIKRWNSFKRHKAQVMKNCFSHNLECRRKQRQALLQWAYNPIF